MTSKEALEKLYDGFQNGMAGRSFYDIIKQDLERLEKFAHENASLHTEIDSLHTENAKLKKVIEILKRKMIIVKLRDNEYIIHGNEYITKEQYELLKRGVWK